MIFMSNRELYLLFSEYHHVWVFTLTLGWRSNTLFWLQTRRSSRSLTRLPKCSIQVCLHFWISCLFIFHSVEISGLFFHSYFTWNQFWRLPFFAIFVPLNLVDLEKFQVSKNAKIYKCYNSKPLNVLKWLILHFKYPQNLFHIKSAW